MSQGRRPRGICSSRSRDLGCTGKRRAPTCRSLAPVHHAILAVDLEGADAADDTQSSLDEHNVVDDLRGISAGAASVAGEQVRAALAPQGKQSSPAAPRRRQRVLTAWRFLSCGERRPRSTPMRKATTVTRP